jgi:hypothetical protein
VAQMAVIVAPCPRMRRARRLGAFERARATLARACAPGAVGRWAGPGSRPTAARERDRRSCARSSLFGRWIACETRCGACDERLELELDGEGLAAPSAASAHDRHTPDGGAAIRPPDSTDIASAGADDPAAVILERCMDPPPASMSQGRERPLAAWPI